MCYKGYLIDLDGTLYRGNVSMEGSVFFVEWLRKKNVPFLFLTNNSTRSPKDVAEKLQRFGIEAYENEVYTSGLAAAEYIVSLREEKTVYAIGEAGLISALKEKGCTLQEKNPRYVVMGMDRNITYDKFKKAALAVQNGARFLSTNPDRAFPLEEGLVPGNGALTSVMTTTLNIQPTFTGKPEPVMIRLALQRLGLKPSEVLMVGDNLDTDIRAGVQSGLDTLLVYTGVSQREDVTKSDIQPVYECRNLTEWINR